MSDHLERFHQQIVRIPAGEITLTGDLVRPPAALGVILFAHGSGSGRHSPRNQAVARHLQERGFATLLLDLLTPEEERAEAQTGYLRFDIDLLARRLAGAADWLAANPETAHLRAGYFGASTGGGAALVAAAARPERAGAVVSRGGRPDLAGPALAAVTCPTRLLVGANDAPVIALNEEAMRHLRCEKDLVIIPGASHLFEEAGALTEVAHLAGDWFARHLTRNTPAADDVLAADHPPAGR